MRARAIAFRFVVGAALASSSLAAISQSADPQPVVDRLVSKYTQLAGSENNAISLVDGLRNGTEITITSDTSSACAPSGPRRGRVGPSGPESVSFVPPTGNMGYGNVNVALGIAGQQLKKAGIDNPKAKQLYAALMGGTVTNCATNTSTELTGILVLRASDQGWGRIANTLELSVNEAM